MLALFAIVISLSACFGYINHKWLKMPTTIGVMLISVLLGIALKIISVFNWLEIVPLQNFLQDLDFSSFVLDFILSFLLFAGSLHVNISDLKGARGTVLAYATIGVLISTFLIGALTYTVTHAFSYDVSLTTCMLFGALISPTDPIAVIGILSNYQLPSKLKTEIVGESLFNDGVGVVVFTVILAFLPNHKGAEGGILNLFLTEVLGGLVIGFLTGYIGYRLMRSIDHYQTEVMITLAVVTAGYSIASYFHASGPLAMVIAGLIIGNKGKADAMSDTTAEYIDKFWEITDEICNAILFVLIGLEIFLIPFDSGYIGIGLLLVFVTLLSRFVSLLPVFYLFNRKSTKKGLQLSVLTWGGLRGGISIALALSLTNKVEYSSLIIVSTYIIVLFSVLVQGLSIKHLLAKF